MCFDTQFSFESLLTPVLHTNSGGGISGLCLAVALSKYHDIQVDVYEASGRFREIGAGVMIWQKTWRILEIMGLAPEFSRIAHAPPDGSIGAYNSQE